MDWLIFLAMTLIIAGIVATIIKYAIGRYVPPLMATPWIFYLVMVTVIFYLVEYGGLYDVGDLYTRFFLYLAELSG